MLVNALKQLNRTTGFSRDKLIGALPVALFFIALFLIVVNTFGAEYAIVVGAFTTTYKVRMNSNNNLSSLLMLILTNILLCLVSYVATVNIFLCIFINMTIPFILVYFQSSQFNPRGYFIYSMTFIFLQLRPSDHISLKLQLTMVIFSSIFLALSLALTTYFKKDNMSKLSKIRDGFVFMSEVIALMAVGKLDKNTRADLFSSLNSYYSMAYQMKNSSPGSDIDGRLIYQFARLFQRLAYLVANSFDKDSDFSEEDSLMLTKLSDLVKEISQGLSNEAEDNSNYILKLQSIQKQPMDDEALDVFYRNFISLLIFFLEKKSEYTEGISFKDRVSLFFEGIIAKIRDISFDSFEFRFAIRLSLVLTTCFAFTFIYPSNHSYWLAIHAFLLLQPMYEDSNQRLKSRPVGTIIGCIAVYLIYPYLNGITGVLGFTFLMLMLMHSAIPGTWIHTVFTTSFAQTLASITMDRASAVEFRIIYLVLAIFIVMIINRFFFSTVRKKLFQYNFDELKYLQHVYLELFKKFIRWKSTIYASMDNIIYFYMIYEEVKRYLIKNAQNMSSETVESHKNKLYSLWRMTSEIEQMEFVLQAQNINRAEREKLYDITAKLKSQMNPLVSFNAIDELLNVVDKLENPDMVYLMNNYIQNIEKLKS